MQRTNICRLCDGKQAKDQGRGQTDQYPTSDGEPIQDKGNIQAKRLADNIAHQITDASCRNCASSSTDEAEQTCFQTKEQKQIKASIADCLEHGNLGFAA